MAPQLRLRLPLSPIALAAVLAIAAMDTLAPVPWLSGHALANHCVPPCDAPPCDCNCNCACDSGGGCAYKPPACR
jgi:hypothetical protein